MIELASRTETTYLDQLQADEISLRNGEKRTWSFSNLLRMDDFVMQLILHSHRVSGERILYQWVPHPWFYFAHLEKVRRYYSAYGKSRYKMKFLIGGDTFLDRRYMAEQRPNMISFRTLSSPFLGFRNTHKLVVGNFILTSTVDARTYRQIDALFDSTRDLGDLSLRKVLALFNSKVRIKLTYELNSRKAKRLVRRFELALGG